MRRPWTLLAVVLLLATAARLCSPPVLHGAPAAGSSPWWNQVSAPFGDDLRGSCNAFLSLLGDSLRREGLAATGGIPLLNVEDCEPDEYWYYDHHTPGVPLVTALAFDLCGRSERTARLVALCFSTLTTLLLLVRVHRSLGAGPAMLAGLAHGFLPMGLYWGTHLNFEVPTLPFLLLFLLDSLRERPARGRALVWLTLAFLLDVVALFGVAAVALEYLGRRRPRHLWPLALGAVVLLGLWMAWRGLQTSRHGHTFASSLLEHLPASTMWSPDFDRKAWGIQVLGSLLVLGGGWPVALLAFECWWMIRRPATTLLDRMFRASLVVATLNEVVPAIQPTHHEYYVLYFQVPLALAAARFGHRLMQGLHHMPRAAAPVAAALALALMVHGTLLDHQRPTPATDHPSAHRLGVELQALAAGRVGVLVLPAGEPGEPTWQLLTVQWYARRLVLEAQPGDTTGASIVGLLEAQGRMGEALLLAEPRQCRDGTA